MKNKLIVLLIALCLIAGQTVTINAAKVVKFDREKALAYAEASWQKDGGDCVKFVRATLEAAGIPKDVKKKGYTSQEYEKYLVGNGYATKYELKWHWHSWSGGGAYYISKTENASVPIEAGDVLLYECTNSGCSKPLFHMSIVCDNKDMELKPQYDDYWWLYQHNKSRNDKIVAFSHKACGSSIDQIKIYVLHMNDEAPYDAKATDVKATLDTEYNTIKLTYTVGTDADGYNVYFKKGTEDTWETVATNTTETSFVKSGLADGASYSFKVVAVKDGKESVNSVAKKCTTLKKVSISSVKTVKSKAKVTWKNIGGESGYEISMSEEPEVDNIVAVYKTTSGTNKSLSAAKGKTYYIKVRAFKTVGETTIYGPWSEVKEYVR